MRRHQSLREQVNIRLQLPHLSSPAWRDVVVVDEGQTDRVMSDRYIIISDGGSPVQYLIERQALQTAAELFDRYGPDTEIGIYLNELLAESILYSRDWMRQWNCRRIARC